MLQRRSAAILLVAVALAWGTSWPVTKELLAYMPPFWTAAARSIVAVVALFAISAVRRRLVLPPRGDIPILLNIALLHMVGFSALVTIGIQFVPVGRSVVLAYTTPLWVMIGARIFLGEAITWGRIFGVISGVSGLLLLFTTSDFNWHDQDAIVGNILVLLAALCWAASILHIRAHRWVSTPFELVPWEILLAAGLLLAMALFFEGVPHVEWDIRLLLMLLYGGVVGIAFPYWATVTVNRNLPAITTSLGLLGVPLVGVFVSSLVLNEPVSLSLVISIVLIVGGIAVGTSARAATAR